MRRLIRLVVVVGCLMGVTALSAPVREGTLKLEDICIAGADGNFSECYADAAAFQTGTNTRTTTGSSTLKVTRYRFTWTSSAGGAVSGYGWNPVHGKLLQIKVKPASGGTQPTDLYDLTLIDEDSLDYLGGAGANLSNAAPKLVLWDPPIMWHYSQNLDVVIANAGNAKSGTIEIWVQAAT